MFIVAVIVSWLVVVVAVEEMRVAVAIVLVGEFRRGEMTGGGGGSSSFGSRRRGSFVVVLVLVNGCCG